MDLIVTPDRTHDGKRGRARWGGQSFDCALGAGGVARLKREGDGASPVGAWPMERLMYRPDRQAPPISALPARALCVLDGWCDSPASPAYNQPVTLPHPASCERMWRRDHLYDLVVILDHNRHPPAPGAGSAIFLHLAHADYRPTAGCIALARADLLIVLRTATTASRVIVEDLS